MKIMHFFDRIYVINLPYRVDRRKAVEKELENAGMPFTPGKVELFTAIRPDSAAPFRSIGTRGCYLSHLAVLKKAREQQLRNVLVIEDDLVLSEHFKKYEDMLIEQLGQTHWDIVHFAYVSVVSAANNFEENFTKLQPFSGEILGTQLYGVDGKVLNRLINFFEVLLERPVGHPEGGPMDTDGVFNVFRWQNPDVVRLISSPSVESQRITRSDITPRWFDQVPVLKSLVTLMREQGITKSLKNLLKR